MTDALPSTARWLKNWELDYHAPPSEFPLPGSYVNQKSTLLFRPYYPSTLTYYEHTPFDPFPNAGAAGVLIFVHVSEQLRVQKILDALNARDRVSEEVHSLYLVKPTREGVKLLCTQLQEDPRLQGLERIETLKANNGLRDLTAKWRLSPCFTDDFLLVVGLETVNDAFRRKYPHPNLTLHAGKIELGETTLEAATRELFEEARVHVTHLDWPIGLMGKGLVMYPTYVTSHTVLTLDNHSVFIE